MLSRTTTACVLTVLFASQEAYGQAAARPRTIPAKKPPVVEAPPAPVLPPRPPDGPVAVRLRRNTGVAGITTLSTKTFPLSIELESEESRVFDVGPRVSALSSNPDAVGVVFEGEFVRIIGKAPGRATVVLLGVEVSKSISVRVIRSTPKELAEKKQKVRTENLRRDLESSLRVRTGGVLQRGRVGSTFVGVPSGGQVGGSALLSGRLLDHGYSLSASQTMTIQAGRVTPAFGFASGEIAGEVVKARYGPARSEVLTLAESSNLSRAAEASIGYGPVRVGAELRSPMDLRTPFVAPNSVRAELDIAPLKEFALQAGSIFPLVDPTLQLPYVGARLSVMDFRLSGAMGRQFSGGVLGERTAFSFRLATPERATCGLSLGAADNGGIASVYGEALVAGRYALSAHARCALGPVFSTVDVVRSPFFQRAGYLGQVRASLGIRGGGHSLRLQAQAFPTALDELGNKLLRVEGITALGPVRLTATGQVLTRNASFMFTEMASAELRLSFLSVGVRGSLTQIGPANQAGFLSGFLSGGVRQLGGMLAVNQPFSIAGGLGGGPAVLVGSLRMAPSDAWSFSLGANGTLGAVPSWQVTGGLSWEFGDETEREAVMTPFRTHAVDVRVIHDENANGALDPGETLVEGAKVCLADDCRTSSANGLTRFDALPEAFVEIKLDEGSLVGLRPTTPPVARVPVGAYSVPVVTMGIRFRVPTTVKVISDANGNGVHDLGETLLREVTVSLSSSFGDKQLELPVGSTLVDLEGPGEFTFSVDAGMVPPGFLLDSFSRRTVSIKSYDRAEVVLGVTPLRSLSGVVCVDQNTDSKCDARDVPVPGAVVSCGERVGVTDTEGRFLLPRLLSELCDVVVGELELPAGVVQSSPPRLAVGRTPQAFKSYSVPLKSDPTAKRATGVRFNWPKVGPAVVVELGGYSMDAKVFRPSGSVATPAGLASWKPSAADRSSIDRVVKLLKEKQTVVSIQVSRDVSLSEEKAQSDADAMLQAYLRWLTAVARVPADKVVTEVVPTSGRGSTVGMRAYQFFRRLKPEEVKEMEEQKAREREERQKAADEAKRTLDTAPQPDGSGQQPSTGTEVPLKRIDVRLRMRMHAR